MIPKIHPLRKKKRCIHKNVVVKIDKHYIKSKDEQNYIKLYK